MRDLERPSPFLPSSAPDPQGEIGISTKMGTTLAARIPKTDQTGCEVSSRTKEEYGDALKTSGIWWAGRSTVV